MTSPHILRLIAVALVALVAPVVVRAAIEVRKAPRNPESGQRLSRAVGTAVTVPFVLTFYFMAGNGDGVEFLLHVTWLIARAYWIGYGLTRLGLFLLLRRKQSGDQHSAPRVDDEARSVAAHERAKGRRFAHFVGATLAAPMLLKNGIVAVRTTSQQELSGPEALLGLVVIVATTYGVGWLITRAGLFLFRPAEEEESYVAQA